jgi:glycosyltransferase involved in cell wall biosynthesis
VDKSMMNESGDETLRDGGRKEIWLISPSGCLEDEGWRPHRYNYAAAALEQSGYRVRWWTAGFSHHSKKVRYENYTTEERSPYFSISFIPCGSYEKHIGLKRIVFLLTFAVKLLSKARQSSVVPEAIVVSTPPPGTELAAWLLSRRFGSVLVVDFIDTWPELFLAFVPKKLLWLARVFFSPVAFLRNWVCRQSSGVMSCCETYLQLEGLKLARSKATESVYWGSKRRIDRDPSLMRETVMKTVGREKRSKELWVVYGGTLGNNYDVMTILDAAKKVMPATSNVVVIIAGGGPLTDEVERVVSESQLDQVFFVGRLTSEELLDLYHYCDVGLSAYISGSTVAMPIKFYDYVTAGLPVINSLGGELAKMIEDHGVGCQYAAGNSDEMARQIIWMTEDRDRLKGMKDRCDLLAAEFAPERQYGKMVRFLELLIKEKTEGEAIQQ